jgi:plasmid stabilization system protein ParE
MRIEWTARALADLDDAFAYLDDRNPEAAQRFFREMFRAVRALATHPEMGPVVFDLEPAGVYRQLIRGYHRVFYRIEDEVVIVLRVWDSRRDPASLVVTE